jgi:hypothetical protein
LAAASLLGQKLVLGPTRYSRLPAEMFYGRSRCLPQRLRTPARLADPSGAASGATPRLIGLAAASLIEAEVVTADGDVKIANACSNPELFWALKGGGSGFGVVTRVTLRTHDRPDVIGGSTWILLRRFAADRGGRGAHAREIGGHLIQGLVQC